MEGAVVLLSFQKCIVVMSVTSEFAFYLHLEIHSVSAQASRCPWPLHVTLQLSWAVVGRTDTMERNHLLDPNLTQLVQLFEKRPSHVQSACRILQKELFHLRKGVGT